MHDKGVDLINGFCKAGSFVHIDGKIDDYMELNVLKCNIYNSPTL